MEVKHTKGKWSQGQLLLTEETKKYPQELWDKYSNEEKHRIFANFHGYNDGKSRIPIAFCDKVEDAERIVACVNACDGITNEELKDMKRYFGKEGRTYYTLVNDMFEAQKQRDELLSVMKMASEIIEKHITNEIAAYDLINNAIKKNKGDTSC